MFFKYCAGNIKHQKLRYFIFIFCEIAMFVITIIANGIMIDTMAEEDNLKWEGKYFAVVLKTQIKSSDIRDDFYEFCDKSPVPIEELSITKNHPDFGTYNYPAVICYFPTYEDLKDYFGEYATGLPTEQQYLNKEKTVILGKGPGYSEFGDHKYTDENHVIVGDDEYFVAGELPEGSYAILFLGSEPEQTYFRTFDFSLKQYPTEAQVKEITQLLNDIIVKDRGIEELYLPRLQNLLDIRKSTANIVLTIFAQVICGFNIMLIFKFMLDSRRKMFAVFRLCGFKKSVCMRYSYCELMITSAVCAAVSCAAVQLLKPVLIRNYSIFQVAFDIGYLLILSLAFLLITTLIFILYVLPSYGKSVSRELLEM